MVPWAVLKELNMATRALQKYKALSAKSKQNNAKRRAAMPRIERSVEYYKARGDKRRTREKAGSSSGTSTARGTAALRERTKMRRPQSTYREEEHNVWHLCSVLNKTDFLGLECVPMLHF